MNKSIFLTLILAALTLLALSPQSLANSVTAPTPTDTRLLKLLQQDLDARRAYNPVEASIAGDRRFDHLLPDRSPESINNYLAGVRARLAQVRSIKRDHLSPANRVNADLLEYELSRALSSANFHPEHTPISQQSGPHINLPQLTEQLSFTTPQHYEDYLARLAAVAPYIDRAIANMRAGLEAGRTPPAVVMRDVVNQTSALLTMHAADPKTHPMYSPFLTPNVDPKQKDRAAQTIRAAITPAFTNLRDFLRDEYVPNCRKTIAASDGPDGLPYYEDRAQSYTTTKLTPQQIHSIGLTEVARIRSEMMQTIARSDFPNKDSLKGDELFKAFIHYLRTDPRFYHQTPEELLTGYRDICKRMDAELPKLFGKLPRLPYGVREMPSFIARSAPTAYYYPGSIKNGVSGTFIANTHRLDMRPKYEMIPLALHEAMPGHHLQIALAQELEEEGLPEWRTELGYTAFVEGWGLYSERLGLEVGGPPGGRGFYQNPYDDFGRLSYEMWRAMRLVVDTGMHALGWSRQQAIDYMLENSALSEANIISEVDRYIAWPGQALGYKIGELKIRELRAHAEQQLADKFNIRAFHDTLLAAGAVPLPILETRIDEWIEETK